MEISNRNLSLRSLRAFCVAAEHGSFRDAAEQLFITASAVSHQIKNLEQDLGVELFARLGRSISLTKDGEILYQDALPLIEQLDDMVTAHRRTATRKVLRISVQPFFGSELFVPGLSEFTERHPDIDIRVDTIDESGEKHPTNADVSIRVFKKPPKKLASHRLFALRLVPAASEPFQKKIRMKGMKVVSEFPRIVHESRPNAWKEWESDSGISLPTKESSVSLASMIAVARAAERGLGAALVPAQLSDSWFESGALKRLFQHELVTQDAFYFACRPEDENKDTVVKFRAWVLQKFDEAA